MAVLIVVGLVVIAAKLVLDLGQSRAGNAVNEAGNGLRVVHMAGAGDHIVLVIEDPQGEQIIRILDPATKAIDHLPLESLLP